MIIECFGLPGAGKTTIAAQLAARLPAELVGVQGRRELIRFNLRALRRHPLKYIRRTARAFHEPSSRELQLYKLRYIFLRRNALVEKARSSPIAIVDEGHVSNILSAFEHSLAEHRMLRELRHLDLPDLALRVALPTAERKGRLEKRGYFSRSSERDEYLRRWEQAMEANSALLEQLLPTVGVRCVAVDGNMPADTVHSSVIEALARPVEANTGEASQARPA
jgi:thymidylate kinase